METVGIRELRQKASQVVEAAENGTTYKVTNHGRDTGVMIGRQLSPPPRAEARLGATPEQIANSGLYDDLKPTGYEDTMLKIVEDGRDRAGRIGDQ